MRLTKPRGRDMKGMTMNGPLVVGGIAGVAGIVGGVVAERASHANLEQRNAAVKNGADAWLRSARGEFEGDIANDRQLNRSLEDRLEDYELAHPRPDSVGFGRASSSWGESVTLPGRDGFWGLTIGAAGVGGGIVGGTMLGTGLDATKNLPAATAGAGILAAEVGVAAGSLVSSWLPH